MKILTAPQSGSQAGTTASRNRFGQYLRTRAIPVQPRTVAQTTIRSYLTTGSSAWRSLTDAQRTAWNDYAAQIQRNDALGSSYSPTGAALYSAATVLFQDGPVITDPPGVLPNYFLSGLIVSYTDPTPGPEALNFAFLTTNADNRFMVQTSGPVSAGITSAAAVRRWRSLPTSPSLQDFNQFSLTSTPQDGIAQYKYLFPSPPSGATIWFRAKEIAYPGGGNAAVTNRNWQTFRLVIP